MYFKILYLGFKIYCFLFRPIRMGARVALIEDGSVWLVRHTYLGGWFMPGGGVQRWETLEEAARREAREETGAKPGRMIFAGVFTSFAQWKTDHTAVFLCEDFTFIGKPDAEIAELRLFPLGELPGDTYDVHRNFLQNFQAGAIQTNVGKW
ncbi:MAG: hypothetical protein KPEEDBHJ_02988 [Anaerolineales bacterium]|nr:hypothetical protein [Anaerolineales bacterium]